MDETLIPQRRPSLYSAIRLARLLHDFRNRLKLKIKNNNLHESMHQNILTEFESEAYVTLASTSPDSSPQCLPSHTKISNTMMCLQSATYGLNPSLDNAARNDDKFLKYDTRSLRRYWSIQKASSVFDNTTLFLEYLISIQHDPVTKLQAATRHGFCDMLDFDKYLANIEHLMRCLQQAALETLVQNSLESLQSDSTYWRKWLERLQSSSKDWFSEWSSGRPPLNSTMPWNIKPSLVVLWGVCWMFYGLQGQSNSPQQRTDDTWVGHPATVGTTWNTQPMMPTAAHVVAATAAYASPASSIAPLQTRVQQHQPYLSHNPAPPPALSQPATFGSPVSNMIGYNVPENMTQTVKRKRGHMSTQAAGFDAQTHGTYGQAASRADISKHITSSAGIHTPLTASTISPIPGRTFDFGLTPNLNTPSSVFSPLQPNRDQTPFLTHNEWSQPNILDGTIYSRPDYNTSSSRVDTYTVPPTTHTLSTSSLYTDTPFNLPQQLYATQQQQQMPSQYPMSPGPGSGRESSVVRVSVGPQTPSNPPELSPSIGESPASRRDSSGYGEPPRNPQGQMTCDDPRCQADPPIFARRCEWKKHKDTHTRPYKCEIPGCEKVQGFTYSGGLLRHKREVHGQHGGPKTPRFCPHPDCKRSTGTGFSRKENLNEHLRRVHRGAGMEQVNSVAKSEPPESPATSNMILPSQQRVVSDPLASRKRRRDAISEESDFQPQRLGYNNSGDIIVTMQQENKRLQQENQTLKQELEARNGTIAQLRLMLQSRQ